MNNSILSHLAKLAFLLFAAGSIFAQPQAGRDYERIPEGLITEPGITEVFGYWCPACYGFEQTVLEMKKRRPDIIINQICLLYTSPSPRDRQKSRMPSSA